MINVKLQLKQLVRIQIWLTSSKYRRESKQTKVKGEKFMLNFMLKFVCTKH